MRQNDLFNLREISKTGVMSIGPSQVKAYEARDRHLYLEVPKAETAQLGKVELEKWITDVCSASFSSAFNYF